jgi:hypothetical protein
MKGCLAIAPQSLALYQSQAYYILQKIRRSFGCHDKEKIE